MAIRHITLLSHDLTGNALSRAYILAKLLQAEYRVTIVGYGNPGNIWEPVRDDASIEYRSFHHSSALGFWFHSRGIVKRLIDGDLIYAVKPMHASFGLGLYARRVLRRPLLLDIDDWELGFISDSVYWEARLLKHRWLWDSQSPLYTRAMDRLIRRADSLTVSSSFLQKRYGGTWIGQTRDETVFDPMRFSAVERPRAKTVLFLGSAREHKGLQDLLVAWPRVKDPDAILRIVGTPLDSPVIQSLRPLADNRVRFEGMVPFEQVPSILATADVFVLPQKSGRASIGQVPMKMIDAMALACPIVGTAVGDIPAWLSDGSGSVVSPDDPAELGDAIQRLLESPCESQKMGVRARERFIRYGSFTSVRRRLLPLVRDMIAGRPLPPPAPAFAEAAAEGSPKQHAAYSAEPCASSI
jgi:glycosyltransferase involved in cell wall biosynthesis